MFVLLPAATGDSAIAYIAHTSPAFSLWASLILTPFYRGSILSTHLPLDRWLDRAMDSPSFVLMDSLVIKQLDLLSTIVHQLVNAWMRLGLRSI